MESTFPKTVDEVSVQLIFGDGNPRYELYILGFSFTSFCLECSFAQRAALFDTRLSRPRSGSLGPSKVAVSRMNSCSSQERVLPDTYHAYFKDVLKNAKLGHERLPDCCLRFVSGHGYGTTNVKDINVKCGKEGEALRFALMGGSAKVLTVLDICANPRAAACLVGVARKTGRSKKVEKKRAFDDLPFLVA